MNIVSMRFGHNTLGTGRVLILTLSDGREVRREDLIKELGISGGAFDHRRKRHGDHSPKVLETKSETKARRFPVNNVVMHQHNEFNRGKVCIKSGAACVDYGKCQDERLMNSTWQKPDGNCYRPEERKLYGYLRSNMSGVRVSGGRP